MENLNKKLGDQNALETTEKPISRNVRHVFPGKKKGLRLRPLFDKLVDQNMSISELARRGGIAKQSMSTRFAVDDCRVSDLEQMAEAVGCKLVWKLEPIEEEEA